MNQPAAGGGRLVRRGGAEPAHRVHRRDDSRASDIGEPHPQGLHHTPRTEQIPLIIPRQPDHESLDTAVPTPGRHFTEQRRLPRTPRSTHQDQDRYRLTECAGDLGKLAVPADKTASPRQQSSKYGNFFSIPESRQAAATARATHADVWTWNLYSDDLRLKSRRSS